MTENELRQKYVKTAIGYIGVAEYTAGHKEILAWYNKQDPLPRGVKMVESYDWCAAFDTAMAVKAGIIDIVPGECSCNRQISLWKSIGRWQENDAYIPEPGDLIYYDWQDSGKGDNVGEADHVGIVVSVSGNRIKVIEGNKGDKVAYRTLSVNGRYIRGYGLPDFASKATVKESPSSKDIVYTVQKGDTLSGIAAKYGTTYQALAAYNNIADANKISVGQKIKIPGTGSTSSSKSDNAVKTESNKVKYIKALQEAMNAAYSAGLAVDGSARSLTQACIDKHYLYYKIPTIKNAHVSWLQDTLKELGYDITVDGSFGPATEKVVKQFQRDHGLVVDGYAGVKTHLMILSLL